jgi:hypothetical protein
MQINTTGIQTDNPRLDNEYDTNADFDFPMTTTREEPRHARLKESTQ